MCQRVAEGVQYQPCGHFRRTKVAYVIDCNSTRCTKSYRHTSYCDCRKRGCIDYWGPDIPKVVKNEDTAEYCSVCKFPPKS